MAKIEQQKKLAFSWAILTCIFINFLYYEKVLFSAIFTYSIPIIILTILILILLPLVSYISQKINYSILKIILIVILGVDSIMWLIIGIFTESGQVPITNNSTVNNVWFQSSMIILNICFMIPVFIRLSNLSLNKPDNNLLTHTTPVVSALIMTTGVFAYYGNDLVFYFNSFQTILILISIVKVVPVLNKNNSNIRVSSDSEIKETVDFSLQRFIIDLGHIFIMLLFGFSMLKIETFSYKLLYTHLGLGWFIYYGIYRFLRSITKEPQTTDNMQGVILFIMLISWEIMAQLVTFGMVANLSIGHTPFIIGIILGYFWHRIYFTLSGNKLPKIGKTISFHQKYSGITINITISIVFFFYFVVSLLNIRPGSWDAGLVGTVALLILFGVAQSKKVKQSKELIK